MADIATRASLPTLSFILGSSRIARAPATTCTCNTKRVPTVVLLNQGQTHDRMSIKRALSEHWTAQDDHGESTGKCSSESSREGAVPRTSMSRVLRKRKGRMSRALAYPPRNKFQEAFCAVCTALWKAERPGHVGRDHGPDGQHFKTSAFKEGRAEGRFVCMPIGSVPVHCYACQLQPSWVCGGVMAGQPGRLGIGWTCGGNRA